MFYRYPVSNNFLTAATKSVSFRAFNYCSFYLSGCGMYLLGRQVYIYVRKPVKTNITSDKNILYVRRLVVYRNQRRWWCKKQGNKACD